MRTGVVWMTKRGADFHEWTANGGINLEGMMTFSISSHLESATQTLHYAVQGTIKCRAVCQLKIVINIFIINVDHLHCCHSSYCCCWQQRSWLTFASQLQVRVWSKGSSHRRSQEPVGTSGWRCRQGTVHSGWSRRNQASGWVLVRQAQWLPGSRKASGPCCPSGCLWTPWGWTLVRSRARTWTWQQLRQ